MRSADLTTRRAQWLAELAEALDQAHGILHRLASEERRPDARDLFARIEAATLEVEKLRLKRSPGGGHDLSPEWSKNLPWKLSA